MRHFLTIGVFALVSSGQAQLPSYVPIEDLVAWFPFDGNALDISGNEQHGVASNVSFLSESGDVPFQYSHFNGDASITIPHNDLWNAEEYTLIIRYKWQLNPSATPNGNSLIVSKRPASGWGSAFEHSPSGGLSWSIDGNGGVGPASPQPQGEWVQTTWVFGVDSIKIYSGGELVRSAVSPGPMNFNSLPISIGMRGNGWHELIGDIDYLGFWSRKLMPEEVLGIHLMSSQVSGCTHPEACNFNEAAIDDDGSCDYGCCPGPGCCDIGMHWDWELGMCQITNVADTNLDGCVQLNDLLDLLSAYGDCGAEESPWQCGDALEYQGYDYETVLIGEQCWFAENLRSDKYQNGDAMPVNLGNSEWSSTTSGATAVYEESGSNLETYGRLYNWFAVDDNRGLCPSGWQVPSDGQWTVLTNFLGGESTSGDKMKTTFGWSDGGNGSNLSGFSGLPGGLRGSNGNYVSYGLFGIWWSASQAGSGAWDRVLSSSNQSVYRGGNPKIEGFSVRCIKDSE